MPTFSSLVPNRQKSQPLLAARAAAELWQMPVLQLAAPAIRGAQRTPRRNCEHAEHARLGLLELGEARVNDLV